jgi:hypothetical protein
VRVTSEVASTWLSSSLSPIAPRTAVNASSTGSPAATSEPNASTRMISVIGIESTSARVKSWFRVLSITWLALAKPNSSTTKLG